MATLRQIERKSRIPKLKRKPKKHIRVIPKDEEIAKALLKMEGKEAFVAEMFGVTVETIKRRIRDNSKLREVKMHIRDSQIDFAEDQLLSLIGQKNFNAIKFFLEAHGKDRGYGKEQVEQTGIKTGVLLINNLNMNSKEQLDSGSWSEIALKQKEERDRRMLEEQRTIDITSEE